MTRPVTILFHKNDKRQLKKKKRKKKKKQIEREGKKQRILWHF